MLYVSSFLFLGADQVGQYFDNVNLESNIKKHQVNIFNNNYYFNTDNGVFSKDGLDFGTRLLLESLPLKDLGEKILDVGCGYGVIPIILSKVIAAEFEGIDVNKRALHLAKMNAKENKVNNINFYESDCYSSVNKKYNSIITNPPIRAGKKIVYEILMTAKDYLLEDGSLFLVIRKEQGAKSAIKDLEILYKVSILNRKKGFFIIKCNLR